MLWLYNIGIILYHWAVNIASLFNGKAKLFVQGRKNIFKHFEEQLDPDDRPIWFHFASLGEFEQGRPVLEKLKERIPDQKFVVTFFSPSGYEIRKNYALAPVFYLPLDTHHNAKKFIELVNPSVAIFTKYEFWHHYFNQLAKNNVPLYLISGIFRPNQAFFKWYGSFYRSMLGHVQHFFVQNEQSVNLLQQIGISEVTLAGDTRFDRVYENANQPKSLPIIAEFCGEDQVFIAGSTWPEDEKLLSSISERYPSWKIIIAPHEIGVDHINELQKIFTDAIKFSDLSGNELSPKKRILIIDNIGMLSSLYQYGTTAYIGGGFGAGIHNTLEAAAFGLPVIFGPKYQKFQEAKDLIAIKAAKSITTRSELLDAFDYFKDDEIASANAKNYVMQKKGATPTIVDYILKVKGEEISNN